MSETKDPIKLAEELEKQIYGDLEQMLQEAEEKSKKDRIDLGVEAESENKEAELLPEVLEFLRPVKSEIDRMWREKTLALEGWKKYKPEQQKTLLEIEVETSLRDYIMEELVAKNLLSQGVMEKAVERLMGEKEEIVAGGGVEKAADENSIKRPGGELIQGGRKRGEAEDDKGVGSLGQKKLIGGQSEKNDGQAEEDVGAESPKKSGILTQEEVGALPGRTSGEEVKEEAAAEVPAKRKSILTEEEVDELMKGVSWYEEYKKEKEEGAGISEPEAAKENTEEHNLSNFDETKRQWALQTYKDFFQEKTDEELVVLKEQMEDKIRPMQKVEIYPPFSPEFNDLVAQLTAIDQIQRQRFHDQEKKVEKTASTADGSIEEKANGGEAAEGKELKKSAGVELSSAEEKFVMPDEFERKEYEPIKLSYDGISKFLESKGIESEKYHFNYLAIFKTEPDPEDSNRQFGVQENFNNYHDYLRRFQNLTEEEKRQLNTFWKSALYGDWQSPDVFTNFYKDLDNSDSELGPYRQEIFDIINAQKEGLAPDLYAEAVKKGEVKRIES